MENNTVDWRTELQPNSRQQIVGNIMDTLKKHLPFSGEDGLLELKKIAERFEEKMYTAASSQSDYLRKISLKMLTMETKSQNPNLDSTNQGGGGNGPPDSGSASGLWQGDSESGYRSHAFVPWTTTPLDNFCHTFENNCVVEESSQQFPHSSQKHNM